MAITVEKLTRDQATAVIATQEGQFSEVKALEVSPAGLTKSISAFANSEERGSLCSIEENGYPKVELWRGFENQEAAAGHINSFEKLFPLGADFQYKF